MKLYTLKSRKFLKACFYWTLFCCLLLASAFVVGCGSDEDEQDDELAQGEAFDASTMLNDFANTCLLYTSPSPRDRTRSRMPSSA